MTISRFRWGVLLAGLGSVFSSAMGADADAQKAASNVISGQEIFLREWLPNDPRSHGGDGLGPVFNESSCVACHNQGGVGGGGSESKNVTVISSVRFPSQKQQQAKNAASAEQARQQQVQAAQQSFSEKILQALAAAKKTKEVEAQKTPAISVEERQSILDKLSKLHPGLAKARSIVLHRSSTEEAYAEWRQKLMLGTEMFAQFDQMAGTALVPPRQGNKTEFVGLLALQLLGSGVQPPREMSIERIESLSDAVLSHPTFRAQLSFAFLGGEDERFGVQVSQRNTTALFGAGLIDSIPDSALLAAARQEHPEYPQATGRVARQKDGKLGRFGWKSQKANLYDFTMTACAVELGLHVPDHPQAGSPHRPEYQPTGYDLNQEECDALVKYLKELPAPGSLRTDHTALRDALKEGERLFTTVGCAACHTAQLGEVVGIYSDLLLHDMGPDSGDSGSYGVFIPDSSGSDSDDPIPEVASVQLNQMPRPVTAHTLQFIADDQLGAASQEWRTAPLWGVRDSAPYMHDGRAKTLEQAIALHGGEGHQSAMNFYRLSKSDQARVLSFLKSLVAPEPVVAAK